VQNPDQFKVVKKGDQVEATYTQASRYRWKPHHRSQIVDDQPGIFRIFKASSLRQSRLAARPGSAGVAAHDHVAVIGSLRSSAAEPPLAFDA
jgi:hypothetical protein